MAVVISPNWGARHPSGEAAGQDRRRCGDRGVVILDAGGCHVSPDFPRNGTGARASIGGGWRQIPDPGSAAGATTNVQRSP